MITVRGNRTAALCVAGALAGFACGDEVDSITVSNVVTDAGAEASTSSSSSSTSTSSSSSSSSSTSSSGCICEPASAPAFTTSPPQSGTDPFTTSPVFVTIADGTPGATIYYTLDGSNPTITSAVYTATISISKEGQTTIRARAIALGFILSETSSLIVDIELPHGSPDFFPPTASPNSGTFNNTLNVALTSDVAGDTICYTTDGVTNPACLNGVCGAGSTTYNPAQPVPVTSTDTIVKTNRCQPGTQASAIALFTYDLQVADMTATGNAANGVTLATTTQTATIHYTTDGSAVTCTTGTIGTQATVTAGTTLNAIGCRDGFQPSTMKTFQY